MSKEQKQKETKLAARDNDIYSYLSDNKKSIMRYAVRKYDHSDFLRTAMLCISESKNLQKCLTTDAGKTQLYHSLKLAATTGLSLNPQEGKACIVAYEYQGKMVANYQIMKKGMIQLLMETGKVKYITAETVRENDEFKISKSMDGDTYTLTPALKNRGPSIGCFAACRLTDNTTYVVYMSDDEIQEHYSKYAVSKKEGAAWNKSREGMALKTVLKKLVRNLHLSDASSAGIGADDAAESELMQDAEVLNVTPVESQEQATDVI